MPGQSSSARAFSFSSIHSVRQFPDVLLNEGTLGRLWRQLAPGLARPWQSASVDHYQPQGIAARCDWQVMSAVDGACRLLRHGVRDPRTVFISLRGGFAAIAFFQGEVLPLIQGSFVLVTGSEDLTIPNQIDQRHAPFDAEQKQVIETIRADERLLAWFAENLDEWQPKFSPLPTGYVFANSGAPLDRVVMNGIALSDRKQSMLCAHRIREGGQWALRSRVSALCRTDWRAFSTVFDRELRLGAFMAQVRAHPFVLCVEGGGLDPSPKAWLTLALGSIPIIRRSPTAAAYEDALPVAVVDRWDASVLDRERLRHWCDTFSSWVTCAAHRQELEYRLSLDYWWNRIIACQRQ